MYSLKYRIKTLAPVIISDNSIDQNLTTTSKLISGNSILGAFATVYISKNKLREAHTDNDFYDMFLSNKISYSNAIIASKNEYGEIAENFTIPNNFQVEKHNHSVVYDKFNQGLNDKPTKNISNHGRIKDKIFTENVKTSIHFHHIRKRETGITKDGGIFNYESIDHDQIFEGKLVGYKETLDIFENNFRDVNTLYLGRSKNTQYGKVNFEFTSDIEEVNDEIINSKFTLSFQSPTIILNSYGFPEVTKQVVEDYFNNYPGITIKISDSVIKATSIENFISIWKMKSSTALAFASGSSFKVEIISGKEEFSKIIKHSIGENTNYGFGIIKIFPLFEQIELKRNNVKTSVEQPNSKMPSIIETMIHDKIEERVLNSIKLKATEDVKSFASERKNKDSIGKLKISNSLIGRLESFAKNLKNISEFKNQIDKIRKTSKDKLESTVLRSKLFIDVLKDNDNTKVETYTTEVAELTALIDYHFSEEFKLLSFKTYWLTFLGFLRKESKKKGGSNV